ncbi:MAG: hypothetical protein ACPL7O_00095, partial [Armatimonadota bacterium]
TAYDRNFPRALRHRTPGDPICKQVYNELLQALGKMDDAQFAETQYQCYGPLSAAVAQENFLKTTFVVLEVDSQMKSGNINRQWADALLLIDIYSSFVFFHEKIIGTMKTILGGNSLSLVSSFLDDFRANRFFDLRNAIVHWNAYIEKSTGRFVFYSKRQCGPNSQVSFIRKEWSIPEVDFVNMIARYLTYAVFVALDTETLGRSH